MRTTEEALEVWQEPVRGVYGDPRGLGLHGLDRMRATIRGELPRPPIHHLTGLTPVEVSPGISSFEMPATAWLQSPAAGLFSAAVSAFVADAPLGSAIATGMPPGKVVTTSDLTMNFVRPASVSSQKLLARARVIHLGRSVGLSEATVEDARGRLVAHGTCRCFVLDLGIPDQMPGVQPPSPHSRYDTPDPYLRDAVGETVPQEEWDKRTGLEVSQAILAGDLPRPPIYHLCGLRLTEVDEGRATFAMPASEWVASPAPYVYGGAIALLADAALTLSVGATAPAGAAVFTLDLKVNFLRPVMPDGRDLVATGKVVHRGRSLGVATGEVVNADGKKIASAAGSSLILESRPWSEARPLAPEEGSPDQNR